MQIRYTEKIGLLLIALSLSLPFYAMIQTVPEDNPTTVVFGPLWQWIIHDPSSFVISPMPLLFFPFWGFGTYFGKMAYDTAKKQNIGKSEYRWKVGKLLALQVIIMLVFRTFVFFAFPPPIYVPLPIVGVVALILTGFTVKEQTDPWEGINPD